jgi:hypothetical protein
MPSTSSGQTAASAPLETLNEERETLNLAARELETTIAKNVAEILET